MSDDIKMEPDDQLWNEMDGLTGLGDSDVQRNAAQAVSAKASARTRQLIVTFALAAGPNGYIYSEVERYIGEAWPEGRRNYNNIGPRNRQLLQRGVIVAIPGVKRVGDFGRACQVFVHERFAPPREQG